MRTARILDLDIGKVRQAVPTSLQIELTITRAHPTTKKLIITNTIQINILTPSINRIMVYLSFKKIIPEKSQFE